jgi:hypothetical protein
MLTLNVINRIIIYKVSIKEHMYIRSPMELCGSIFFLAELCRAVEGGKLDVSQMTNVKLFIKS